MRASAKVVILPVRPRRPPRPLPRHLTVEQLAAFRAAVRAAGSARDDVMFGLAYALGLRAGEVVGMLVDDVDLARGRVVVRRLKRGDTKEYALPADLARRLKAYLRRRPDRGPFLFVGREATNQRGISRDHYRKLFRRYARAAGLPPGTSSHCLRHSIAVHALDSGYDLALVADRLGHRSIASTAIYARVSSRARDEMSAGLDASPHVLRW